MVKYLEILDNALHPRGLKSLIMVPALRSLREQNIQTACKETPADDEELTRRMELTKAKYRAIALKIFLGILLTMNFVYF